MNFSFRSIALLFALLLAAQSVEAQQAQEQRRSNSVFLFPEFVQAKVLMPFGRSTKADVNILLKASTLCFMQGDSILEADVSHIIGVEVNDSIQFRRITPENTMGLVVATKGYNQLLRVTTIDVAQYDTEEKRHFYLGFDNMRRNEDYEYPLKDAYYFFINGEMLPANEKAFKNHIPEARKKDFKALMANRWWSWRDEESLMMLLEYVE